MMCDMRLRPQDPEKHSIRCCSNTPTCDGQQPQAVTRNNTPQQTRVRRIEMPSTMTEHNITNQDQTIQTYAKQANTHRQPIDKHRIALEIW